MDSIYAIIKNRPPGETWTSWHRLRSRGKKWTAIMFSNETVSTLRPVEYKLPTSLICKI